MDDSLSFTTGLVDPPPATPTEDCGKLVTCDRIPLEKFTLPETLEMRSLLVGSLKVEG